jgi:hypothetical protein
MDTIVITLMFIRIHLFPVVRIRIRIRLFTLMRIHFLLLIKGMRICDHWSEDFPGLHVELLWCAYMALLFAALKLLYFYFNADPDPQPIGSCFVSPSSVDMLLAVVFHNNR